MPVPSTQEIRKPLLEAFKGEAPRSFVVSEILAFIAEHFNENLDEMSSTEKTALKNNINEAKTYLRDHKLLSHPSKNTYMITSAGSKLLDDNPNIIDDDYFEPKKIEEPEIPVDFSEEEFNNAPEEEIIEEVEENADTQENIGDLEEMNEEIPEELNITEEQEITENNEDETEEEHENTAPVTGVEENEKVLADYNSNLAEKILERVAAITPDMFCTLVIDLLSKMGYRAFQTARYTIDAEGSDLIHGVILENKPGMTPIYIHARKLSPSKTIGKSDMTDFVNILSDKGGKGIFATTGTFTQKAEESAQDEGVMLLDGKKLASLMIANDFCINTVKIFQLKSIDTDNLSEYEG